MRKELSLKEIQIEELSLLKKTIDILNSNDLKYYLYGGTLLGAIRHQGFIPWDDDIDIIMPRPDYEKFIKILHNNTFKDDFCPFAYELNNSFFPFCKMINKNIVLENKFNIDKYLWIDVFPLDGIPNNINSSNYLQKFVNRRKTYTRKLYQIYHIKDDNILKYFIKLIIFFPLRFLDFNKIINSFILDCKKYDFNNSKYVCDLVWAVHPGNILEKKWLDKTISVRFEDIEANAFIGYKFYLKNRYGKDYMKLPPENQRVTHSFKAWRTSNEK